MNKYDNQLQPVIKKYEKDHEKLTENELKMFSIGYEYAIDHIKETLQASLPLPISPKRLKENDK